MKPVWIILTGIYCFLAGITLGALCSGLYSWTLWKQSEVKKYNICGYEVLHCDRMITSPYEFSREIDKGEGMRDVSLRGNSERSYSFQVNFVEKELSEEPELFTFVLRPKICEDNELMDTSNYEYAKENIMIGVDNREQYTRYTILLKNIQNDEMLGWKYCDENGDGHIETKINLETKQSYILIGNYWNEVEEVRHEDGLSTAYLEADERKYVFDCDNGWVLAQ